MPRQIAYLFMLVVWLATALQVNADPPKRFLRFRVQSRLPGLQLSVLHLPASGKRSSIPVLFVHGASFPSALAAGFRMQGISWMDDLATAGYDVYALDFLGYGDADRYPQMSQPPSADPSFSTGKQVAQDLDRAVDAILKRTKARKIHLIGHSWGATVCAYYTSQHKEKVNRLVLFAPFAPSAISPNNTEPNVQPAAYQDMTPAERVAQFRKGVPPEETQVLAPELSSTWPEQWLRSDPTAATRSTGTVRFPSGWELDLAACMSGRCFYDPTLVAVPTLLIRGEWDQIPNAQAADQLFRQLVSATLKRYVVIERGTHVLHLEKSRFQLYSEVRNFLTERFNFLAP